MYRYLLTVLLLTLTLSSTQARLNPLEREMEHYARNIIRAHPELAGGKKTRDARADIYNKVKKSHILDLSKEDAKKLRKHQSLISEASFQESLKLINSIKEKKPEVDFLAKYASRKKIKPIEKLLAYRLMEQMKPQLQRALQQDRNKSLLKVLTAYTNYKSSHDGKIPTNIEDLQLPDDCSQFVHPNTSEKSDWVYLAHPTIHLKYAQTFIIIAEPEPINGYRTCGLDNGKIVSFKEDSIANHLSSTLQRIKQAKEAPAQPPVAKKQPENRQPPRQRKVSKKRRTIHLMANVIRKCFAYKQTHQGKFPPSLDDLELADDEKQYIDPQSGKRYDWVYYGNNSPLNAGNGVRIFIVSPKTYQGRFFVGLTNGKLGEVPEEQLKKRPKQ